MAMYDEAAAQTAEMLELFPRLVRADREAMLRFMRARAAKYAADGAGEMLFVSPVASLVFAHNSGVF